MNKRSRGLVAMVLLSVAAGCSSNGSKVDHDAAVLGSAGSTGSAGSAGSASAGSGAAGGSANGDAGAPDAGSSTSAAAAAAEAAATTDSMCTPIAPFYWEIGDASQVLASGSVGTRYSATTAMGIASASKLVFGAYVVERFKGKLGDIDLSAMTMRSGYTSLNYTSCIASANVKACLDAAKNGVQTAADVGHFFYNGGHFQKYAVDLGLGADDDAQLASEIGRLLGADLGLAYSSPQLAAGMRVTPTTYAHFLQKLLRRQLELGSHLGEQAVCTLPGSSCPNAVSSPVPLAWHYSYGHWVEDDPQGDGAFSSPGAFGFYPWIDAHQHYYGIVARQSAATDAYKTSVYCGQAIRNAFLSALP